MRAWLIVTYTVISITVWLTIDNNLFELMKKIIDIENTFKNIKYKNK